MEDKDLNNKEFWSVFNQTQPDPKNPGENSEIPAANNHSKKQNLPPVKNKFEDLQLRVRKGERPTTPGSDFPPMMQNTKTPSSFSSPISPNSYPMEMQREGWYEAADAANSNFAKTFGGNFLSGLGVPTHQDAPPIQNQISPFSDNSYNFNEFRMAQKYNSEDYLLGTSIGSENMPKMPRVHQNAMKEREQQLTPRISNHKMSEEQQMYAAHNDKRYLTQTQIKMLQSVKSMSNSALKIPTDSVSGYENAAPLSPISPISPISNSNYNENYMPISHYKDKVNSVSQDNNNITRTNLVRKCASDLYKIRPGFNSAVKNVYNQNPGEAKLILNTVGLYSQILCNWKKQTLYVYRRMRCSLTNLQYKLETEMIHSRSLYTRYKSAIDEMKKRNEELEINLKSINPIKNPKQRPLLESGISKTENAIAKELSIRNEQNAELRMRNAELEKLFRNKSFIPLASNKRCTKDDNELFIVLSNTKKKIELIHKKLLGNVDNELKNSSSDSFERSVCKNLMAICSDLEGVIESKIPGTPAKKQKGEPIELLEILNQRIGPDGKKQFYVACSTNHQSQDDVSVSGHFEDHVWVDENTLVGYEDMIRRFEESQKNNVKTTHRENNVLKVNSK